ncbi:hypothetical protein [uncultured Clostridium sp.]|uniref:hypothetical protein n=1 Tax=uncultured Clostridium sp. TaxID=59620 RepID=UPI0025EBCF99|nr:hypothetical protein [uncultured Clostridium sp.]
MKSNKRFLEHIEKETKLEISGEHIKREDLKAWWNELELGNLSDEYTSLEIKNILLKEGVTYLDFYNRFKDRAYGIHPSRFENRFKINPYQRRKMIETKFLNIAYFREEEIFKGRFEKVPFFNAEQYFNLTFNDVELWRADHIRGYNEKQLKLDI